MMTVLHVPALWAQKNTDQSAIQEEYKIPECYSIADSLFWWKTGKEQGDITKDALVDIFFDQIQTGIGDTFPNGEIIDSFKIIKYSNGSILLTAVEPKLTKESSSEITALFLSRNSLRQEDIFFKYPACLSEMEIMRYLFNFMNACEDSILQKDGGPFDLKMCSKPVLCADTLKEEDINSFISQFPRLYTLVESFDE